ncbi:MAG: FkbM family methyltransferase [Cellulosilyticaceae bacterium]
MPAQSKAIKNKDLKQGGEFLGEYMPTQIDTEFKALMEFVKERDYTQIKDAIIQNLKHLKEVNNPQYMSTVDYCNKYKLWGTYYPDKGDYALAESRAEALVGHREDLEWVYKHLADVRSKRVFTNILYYWLMSNFEKINQIHDKTFEQYFDQDIIKCSKDEVFVDIGAYVGDTLVSYVQNFGKDCYKTIYCYEIVPANIDYINQNIKNFQLNNVVIRAKGASSKEGVMYFESGNVSPVSQLADSGELSVPVVKIDDDLVEKATFIKMDIEGGEEEAILGCAEQIKKNHPKLAISIYHNHKDIWKIARMIHEIDDSYHFYIRYYGTPYFPTEYILYGI